MSDTKRTGETRATSVPFFLDFLPKSYAYIYIAWLRYVGSTTLTPKRVPLLHLHYFNSWRIDA
ncbi:MAG: hypothetical protein D6691_02615 [Candidatus Hydrogenedentota bacterium]|nr:MAG: hypothetical protein D6691_02615 [Candidatus Hydrogenedentota bacterium]